MSLRLNKETIGNITLFVLVGMITSALYITGALAQKYGTIEWRKKETINEGATEVWSKNGQYLYKIYMGDLEMTGIIVKIYDKQKNEIGNWEYLKPDGVQSYDISPNGELCLINSYSKTLWVLDKSGKILTMLKGIGVQTGFGWINNRLFHITTPTDSGRSIKACDKMGNTKWVWNGYTIFGKSDNYKYLMLRSRDGKRIIYMDAEKDSVLFSKELFTENNVIAAEQVFNDDGVVVIVKGKSQNRKLVFQEVITINTKGNIVKQSITEKPDNYTINKNDNTIILTYKNGAKIQMRYEK
ncbi:MAG: hypothetical protein Q7U71_02820 [bacterium]|nr:hypothetical protein [bacterium]